MQTYCLQKKENDLNGLDSHYVSLDDKEKKII